MTFDTLLETSPGAERLAKRPNRMRRRLFLTFIFVGFVFNALTIQGVVFVGVKLFTSFFFVNQNCHRRLTEPLPDIETESVRTQYPAQHPTEK